MSNEYHTKTIYVPLLGSPSKNISFTLVKASSLAHYSGNLIVKLLYRQRFVDRSQTYQKGFEVCCYMPHGSIMYSGAFLYLVTY